MGKTAEHCSGNFPEEHRGERGAFNEGLDQYCHLHESLQGFRWKEREQSERKAEETARRAAVTVKVYKQAKWSHTDGRTHTEGRL